MLLAALALSFGVQDFIEGAVIAAVIVLNTTYVCASSVTASLNERVTSVGFFQEYRAEKTMESLRQLSSPTALVIRNGESLHVPAKTVVPGDVVMIKDGDVVPSDVCTPFLAPAFSYYLCLQLRLISTSNLEVSEQLLTGESVPGWSTSILEAHCILTLYLVAKDIEDIDDPQLEMPIGDRLNLCYSSTVVTKGRGVGIAIGTGMNTQVRAIVTSKRCDN